MGLSTVTAIRDAGRGGASTSGSIFRTAFEGGGWRTTGLHTVGGGDIYGPSQDMRMVEGPDGRLYGTGTSGSDGSSYGGVFVINRDGSDFRAAVRFHDAAPTPGRSPRGGLLLTSDGWLYGTTSAGGLYGGGTFFRLHPPGPPPCHNPRLVRLEQMHGVADDFVGMEPAFPSPGLLNWAAGAGITELQSFDDSCSNIGRFADSFVDIPPDVVQATLRIHLKACGPFSDEDMIQLWFVQAGGLSRPESWNSYLGTDGFHGLLPTAWVGGTEHEFALDLARLPSGDGSTVNLLSVINETHSLDIMVMDNTLVDYAVLEVTTRVCGGTDIPCAENLLANGSFEDPGAAGGYERLAEGSRTIVGWRAAGSGLAYQNPRPPSPLGVEGLPADGNYIVNLSIDGPSPGSITQEIATEPGRRYWLAFSAGTARQRGANGTGLLKVVAGRTATGFNLNASGPEITWRRGHLSFVATDPLTSIEFTDGSEPSHSFVLLDDVRVSVCCLGLEVVGPDRITVPCDSAEGAIVTSFGLSFANACPGGEIHVIYDRPPGTRFPKGITTVSYIATQGEETVSGRFEVEVTGECAGSSFPYGGTAAEALGHGLAERRDDGSLRMSGITDSFLDGLRFNPGDVEGIRVNFDKPLPAVPMPPRAAFEIAVQGDGMPVASLRMDRNASLPVFDTLPDFGALHSDTYMLRLYNGDKLVLEQPGLKALSDHLLLPTQPQSLRVALRPGTGLVFEYFFGGSTELQVSKQGTASNYNADRMEVSAGAVGVIAPMFLTGLEIKISSVDERIITGMAVTKFGQEVRASQGAIVSGITGELALRTQPSPPAVPLPVDPPPPNPWDLLNDLGYFTDLSPGNPAGYSGSWPDQNPLGIKADWDMKIDLTDKATAPLGLDKYRSGKSSAQIKFALPAGFSMFRVVAGGARDASLGSVTMSMGALLFEGKDGRVEASFNPAPTPTGLSGGDPANVGIEARLTNGSIRHLEGAVDQLKVSWNSLEATREWSIRASIGRDGGLGMAFEPADPNSFFKMRLPDGAEVEVFSVNYSPTGPLQGGGQTWLPGSLRALLLAGKDLASLSIRGLDPSTINPTPSSYFKGLRISPLGNGSFHHDAFGNLVLTGLWPGGDDGIAVDMTERAEVPVGATVTPLVDLELGGMLSGAYPFPPPGARLDLRLVSKPGDPIALATLAGETVAAGGPFLFGVNFPKLNAMRNTNTLRVFQGNQLHFEQKDRPAEAPGSRGNLAPEAIPNRVTPQIINGQLAWVLEWNHPINISVFDQSIAANPIRGDRVEIVAQDADPYPSTTTTLELRASLIETLQLLNLARYTPASRPDLNFHVVGSRLELDWGSTLTTPKLQIAPLVNGPWSSVGLGKVIAPGRRGHAIDTTRSEGYIRLGPLGDSEGCLDFSDQDPGDRANAWTLEGWKFDRYRADGSHDTRNEIGELDGVRALTFDGRLDIELPAPAFDVDLGFVYFASPVKLEAFDDLSQADEVFVNAPSATDRTTLVTLHSRGGRPLRRLRITAPGKLVHLRELCLRAFEFHHVEYWESCLDLRSALVPEVPNPWVQEGMTITASDDFMGTMPAAVPISAYPDGSLVGYEVKYKAELTFDPPSPGVEITYICGSALIEFQARDETGADLPLRRRGSTDPGGVTEVFSAAPHLIASIVITTPNDKTRLLKICRGPMTEPFCRRVTFWDGGVSAEDVVFRAISGVFVPGSYAGESGTELPAETLLDIATGQLEVDLRLVVGPDGATISAEATTGGGRVITPPEMRFTPGPQTLSLRDTCPSGCGENIRHIRLRLLSGHAIMTRICTQRTPE